MSKRQPAAVKKPKRQKPQKVPRAVPDSIKWLGYFFVPFEGP